MSEKVRRDQPRRKTSGRWWVAGLVLAALIVIVLAPLASEDPDGLERVAIDQGFADRAGDAPFSIIADYVFPGLDGPAATIAAGLIGVLLVFAIIWLVGRLLARSSPGPDR